MIVDHIGAMLIEPLLYNPSSSTVGETVDWQTIHTSSRLIGRLVFLIFCFLIIEGYVHTRSVSKHAFRLGLFALFLKFNLI